MIANKHRLENWDDLRFFLAVARSGGLSGGARLLGVNQSTVFRRISQLEAHLGARLFDRQARGYQLTAIGEDMLGLATKVEEDILTLDRTVFGADSELRGTIKVTTVGEMLPQLAEHFKHFRERYPGIHIEVSTEQRLLNLSHREADIAIRPGKQPTEPDVIARKLVSLQSCAYASKSYLEAKQVPESIEQLTGHDLISFNNSHWLTNFLTKNAIKKNIVYSADNMTGQCIAASAGIGVAFLPAFIGDKDKNLTKLFTLPETGDDYLWLIIHSDLRQTARIRVFMEFITQVILVDKELYEGSGK